MKLNTNLNYQHVYEYIIEEIKRHEYLVFIGDEDAKINPIFRHNPFNDENQKISLISRELLKKDLNQNYLKFTNVQNITDSNNYLFFELVLNGFKEKYQNLNDLEIEILKTNLINEGYFIDVYMNALIIGVNKNFL